jgi:hypothetical protein
MAPFLGPHLEEAIGGNFRKGFASCRPDSLDSTGNVEKSRE